MEKQISIKQVERAIRRFGDYADDVRNSTHRTFDAFFQVFMDFCETDEVIGYITRQLKSNENVDAKKWVEDCREQRAMVLMFDEEDRIALFYKFMYGIFANQISLQDFWISVFTGNRYDEMIYDFNQQIFEKFVRDINYRLEELEEKIKDKESITGKDLIIFQHYDINIVNNGVMTVGNENVINDNRTMVQNLITQIMPEIDVTKLLPESVELLNKLQQKPEVMTSDETKSLFEDIVKKFPALRDKLFGFIKNIPPELARTVIVDGIKTLLGV